MQSLEIHGMDELNRVLDEVIKEFPNERRRLHERIADIAENIVKQQAGNGTLANMQESFVGSKGGYAAVKPRRGETGPNSPGAITNYNENGHRIRRPSGLSKRYRPRIHTVYVSGRHFYQKSRSLVEAAAIRECENFASELAKKLGG